MNIPECILRPQIRLAGPIDEAKFTDFRSQLDEALAGEGPIGFELTTLGGDADLARRIGLDLLLVCEQLGRDIIFVGKTAVYSAGVTIMAAIPRNRRYLTRDCVLLIHERRLDLSLNLSGPLRANLQRVKEIESQLKVGLAIERDGFAMLCRDSRLDAEECYRRACTSWYCRAEEALDWRLVEGVI